MLLTRIVRGAKSLLAVYGQEKTFKETKTYKMENTEHRKVAMIGIFLYSTRQRHYYK